MARLSYLGIALFALALLPSGAMAQDLASYLMPGALNLAMTDTYQNRLQPSTQIAPTKQSVFRAKIKRREGRTPIIDVVFNGQRKFEMIVDTGANDTVITQKIAAELKIVPVGKLRFDTASAKGIELAMGRVNSLRIDGAVARNLLVAIAGPELETGLLGHDFFGDYDITIKRDVVEFRVRS